uniref:Uncharacterized protein n=1 Tax=Anguilla anguilla TaxID=7936 RepID=A0A0E9SGZ8_ANGAN
MHTKPHRCRYFINIFLHQAEHICTFILGMLFN